MSRGLKIGRCAAPTATGIPKLRTRMCAAGYDYLSARTRSFISRRSWASMVKVAIGRALRRITPIGSPVSSQ